MKDVDKNHRHLVIARGDVRSGTVEGGWSMRWLRVGILNYRHKLFASSMQVVETVLD